MKESMKKAAIGFFFKKSRNDKPVVRSQSNQDPVRKEGLGQQQTESEKHCTVHETIVFSENVARQYQHEIHVTEERRNFIIDEEFLYDGDGDPEKIYSELKRKSLRQQHIEEEEKKLSDSIKGATKEDQPVQKTPRSMPTKKEEPKKVMSEAYKKIKKFLDTSPSHERLDFTQNMLRMAQQLGRELTNQGLLPAMQHIAKDNREIKSALIDQFMPLINFMSEDEQGYKQATETIMPLINDFMYDKIEVVRDKAIKILADFCDILKPDDRGDYILTSVLKLAHENEDENARASALKVLNQLAGLGLLSIELIENFIVMEVSALGGDEYQVVRQAVAENLLNICKNVSPDCFNNKIIPLFRQLSKDQDALVRKACSEQTPVISSVSIETARENEFTDIYLNFLKDNAKAVRSSSYEHLGPFIATLKGLQIHETLIESFIKMSENSSKEVQLQCAFNLPGVLWTLGEQSWPVLRKVYLKLVKLSDARVKRTLSFSIHEISKIIGEKQSEEDLLPILKIYLRDNFKDVRIGALKGLPDFLENISVQSRLPFIDTLATDDIQKDWRMQVIIANNIGKLALLFPSILVKSKLTQIFYKYSHNRIHAIRKPASNNLVYFLQKFQDDPDYQEQMIKTVKLNFFRDQAYWRRLSFLNMAAGVMINKDLFETHFIDEFIELGHDKVSNVRIVMAKILKNHFNSNGNFIFDERINKLVDLLKTDKDSDVLSNVKDIQTMPQKDSRQNSVYDQIITADTEQSIQNELIVENEEHKQIEEDCKEKEADVKENQEDNIDENVEGLKEKDLKENVEEIKEKDLEENVEEIKEIEEDIQKNVEEIEEKEEAIEENKADVQENIKEIQDIEQNEVDVKENETDIRENEEQIKDQEEQIKQNEEINENKDEELEQNEVIQEIEKQITEEQNQIEIQQQEENIEEIQEKEVPQEQINVVEECEIQQEGKDVVKEEDQVENIQSDEKDTIEHSEIVQDMNEVKEEQIEIIEQKEEDQNYIEESQIEDSIKDQIKLEDTKEAQDQKEEEIKCELQEDQIEQTIDCKEQINITDSIQDDQEQQQENSDQQEESKDQQNQESSQISNSSDNLTNEEQPREENGTNEAKINIEEKEPHKE